MVRAVWVLQAPAWPALCNPTLNVSFGVCQAEVEGFDGTSRPSLYPRMITPAQCRAARALLKWTQEDLAARCDVSVTTIRTFETEATAAYARTREILKATLEVAGIEFIDEGEAPTSAGGQGVRLRV